MPFPVEMWLEIKHDDEVFESRKFEHFLKKIDVAESDNDKNVGPEVAINLFQDKGERLKVPTFIYRHLHGNQNSSGLQLEVAY